MYNSISHFWITKFLRHENRKHVYIQNGISFPSHYDLAVQVNSTQNVLGRSENFNLMTTQA